MRIVGLYRRETDGSITKIESPVERVRPVPEVITSFGADGTVAIYAYDLVTDAWDDFRDHLREARRWEADGNHHGRNRSIRSGLMSLYGHLDGVVMRLHDHVSKARRGIRLPPPSNGREYCIREMIGNLVLLASRAPGARLGNLFRRLKLKPLRDLLAHPSLRKGPSDAVSQALARARPYQIALKELAAEGDRIADWLNRACAIFEVNRLTDTRSALAERTKRWGRWSKIERV